MRKLLWFTIDSKPLRKKTIRRVCRENLKRIGGNRSGTVFSDIGVDVFASLPPLIDVYYPYTLQVITNFISKMKYVRNMLFRSFRETGDMLLYSYSNALFTNASISISIARLRISRSLFDSLLKGTG